MKKKVTLTKLKKKAWELFSKYIRIKYSDEYGICTCVSCGVRKPWKEMQAGHYISRRYASTLFDERNVHPQCVGCNMFNQGNIPGYVLFLDKTYGPELKEELYILSKQSRKFTAFELEEMIEKYKKWLSENQK